MTNWKSSKSKYWSEMCEIIDNQFPKGKCKERGRALVALACIEMLLEGEDGEPKEKENNNWEEEFIELIKNHHVGHRADCSLIRDDKECDCLWGEYEEDVIRFIRQNFVPKNKVKKENKTWEEELEELLSPYPRLPYEMKDLRDKFKSFIHNRFLPKDKVRELTELEDLIKKNQLNAKKRRSQRKKVL